MYSLFRKNLRETVSNVTQQLTNLASINLVVSSPPLCCTSCQCQLLLMALAWHQLPHGSPDTHRATSCFFFTQQWGVMLGKRHNFLLFQLPSFPVNKHGNQNSRNHCLLLVGDIMTNSCLYITEKYFQSRSLKTLDQKVTLLSETLSIIYKFYCFSSEQNEKNFNRFPLSLAFFLTWRSKK